MLTIIKDIAQLAGCITGIAAAAVLLVKPLREWCVGTGALRDGQKCLLRHNMLHTYYRHRDARQIRQYELEDFIYQYKAYKAMHGNSFVDIIYNEVKEWEVVT